MKSIETNAPAYAKYAGYNYLTKDVRGIYMHLEMPVYDMEKAMYRSSSERMIKTYWSSPYNFLEVH